MASLGYSDKSAQGDTGYIPVGNQNLTVHKCMMTKKSQLCIVLAVDDGADEGAMIALFYLIHNSNPICKRIAREELQKLAFALGLSSYDETDDFLDLRCNADVGIEAGTGGYPDKPKLSFTGRQADKKIKKEAAPIAEPKKDHAETPASKEFFDDSDTPF